MKTIRVILTYEFEGSANHTCETLLDAIGPLIRKYVGERYSGGQGVIHSSATLAGIKAVVDDEAAIVEAEPDPPVPEPPPRPYDDW